MSEPLIGEIRLFAGSFTPRGWAQCDGRLLSISQNSALFSVLGTSYGGDGMTTFAVPDLRPQDVSQPRKPVNYIIALEGAFPARA